MRTAVISDIHIDVNEQYPVMEELITYIKKNDVEAILIAGDISSSPILTQQLMQQLEEKSGIEVWYVPGNHDLWHKDEETRSTEEIYESFCNDPRCLSGKIIELGNHVVIGDVAWFDYSFGNQRYSNEEFELMSRNGRTWQDSLFNDWSKDNQTCCQRFLDNLEHLLQECKTRYPQKGIVFMTHMISNVRYCVPEEIMDWSYFNAFLGSSCIEELCKKYQPEYAICGHVHYRETATDSGVTWLCRCLNYHTEWQENKDTAQQLSDAIEVIEL